MHAFILDQGAIRETGEGEAIRAAYVAKLPLWLDLDEQTPEADLLLKETFGLHPLAIEDIWSDATTPKVEDFERYLYVLANGVHWQPPASQIELRELDLVFGEKFLITHHTGPMRAIDGVAQELRRSPRLMVKGIPWLAHSILDHMVDNLAPVMDAFDDQIEQLETDVIAKAGLPEGRDLLGRIFDFKRSLQSLRRAAIHQRELLLRLSRGEFAAIPADALPFYRDVYDHFARFTDLAEGYRDLVTSALDAYLSVQSNRMNEIMKTLTLISTVMLPLTFIAGVYGMNFKYIPELSWPHGYAYALALMGSVAVGIVLFFRRKRWL